MGGIRFAMFVLSLGFVICYSTSIFAHAVMVKSMPEKDSEIVTSPEQIDVWFNEDVRGQHKALAVINSSGKRMDNRDIEQETFDRSHIYVTAPSPLPPDTYTVRYRVISADTHVVTGRYKFKVVESKASAAATK